jgi:beta-glucosidase
VSTSAYQIEGSRFANGAGECVWDQFSDQPGKIWGGNTAAVACDHYARVEEDFDLLRRLPLQAYHFTVSWPRVFPDGTGKPNEHGLAFYDRMVDALLRRGITPWVTLFHWDYPTALYEQGGWLNRDCARWFADYAALIVDRLSDRVEHFITLGEPECFVTAGSQKGQFAPGDVRPIRDVLQMGYNAFLAHGRGVQAMRAAARQPIKIALKVVGEPYFPCPAALSERGREADIEAARELTFRVDARPHAPSTWYSALWMDPVYLGRYPEGVLEGYGSSAPKVHPDDLKVMSEPLDFFSLNTYRGGWARATAKGPEAVPFPPGYPASAYDWPITPECMYWGPRFFHERYRLPIAITENGLAARDWVAMDGRIRDYDRIDFIRRSLLEVKRAVDDGIPIDGYFHWSLFDNFEWDQGYRVRFGLVHVDFATQVRTPKDSFDYYAKVMGTNGACLADDDAHLIASPMSSEPVSRPKLSSGSKR